MAYESWRIESFVYVFRLNLFVFRGTDYGLKVDVAISSAHKVGIRSTPVADGTSALFQCFIAIWETDVICSIDV